MRKQSFPELAVPLCCEKWFSETYCHDRRDKTYLWFRKQCEPYTVVFPLNEFENSTFF